VKRDGVKGDEVKRDGVKGDEMKGHEQKCEDERLYPSVSEKLKEDLPFRSG
jgi:hypothetical protein